MTITTQEVIPLGLCISTQELMDAKRYQHNFCDNVILRGREKKLESRLIPIKRELNSTISQTKYLEGHKAVIVSNIDKIIGLVAVRYANTDLNLVNAIVENGKLLIGKVLNATSFDDITELEPVFRSKVSLPVQDLFIRQMKKSGLSMI